MRKKRVKIILESILFEQLSPVGSIIPIRSGYKTISTLKTRKNTKEEERGRERYVWTRVCQVLGLFEGTGRAVPGPLALGDVQSHS